MKQALLLAVLLAAIVHSYAATPLRQIEFSISPVTEKLTQQSVRQSFQDSDGALWFVTQEGLNKYTGQHLENYRYSVEDENSLSSDHITRIVEDKNGILWMSTIGGGLNFFDPKTNGFSSFQYSATDRNTPLSNDISTLFVDDKGLLWLGYVDKISTFDTTNNSFKHVIPDATSIPTFGEVKAFSQTPDGRIWAATQSAGLIQIDPKTLELSPHDFRAEADQADPIPQITDIRATKHKNIWITTAENGVFLYNLDSGSSKQYSHSEIETTSLSSNQAFNIFIDQTERVWIGTNEGLNLYVREADNFVRYTSANSGLPEDVIFSVYQSKEGQYWVGTLYGLAMGSESHFLKFDVTNGQLSSNSVNAFGETADGSVWVGTDTGLNRKRPGSASFEWINQYTSPAISSPVVMSLLGEDNILWIGTFDAGLNRLDIDTNEVEVFRNQKFDDSTLRANGVTSFLRTRSGKLLIGTYGGGISIFNEKEKTFKNLLHESSDPLSLSNNNVLAIYQDSFGYIWVGTENGLNRFDEDRERFDRYYSNGEQSYGMSSDMVWAFHEDADKTLWLGTAGGGLVSWNSDFRKELRPVFTPQASKLSLPSSNIYGIQSDMFNNIWISHNRGITRINSDRLKTNHYGVRDGLQAAEFNMGASYKSPDGRIFFGGSKGFNIIDPKSVQKTGTPPQVTIYSINVMNERRLFETRYNELSLLELDYEDKMLSIEFFAADYSAPDSVQYAYKIEGLNPNWTISEDARVVSITTLPPGNYTLKLAAASPDGTWNWDGRSLPIKVSPPPWLSPIAYTTYIILAFAAIAYFLRKQKKQANLALQRQRELEIKVEERTADLEEARKAAVSANSAKSDFLATMSHEIRTPMHGMIGMTELLLHTELSDQQRQFAKAAHNSGESLLKLINEILDFSKIEASKVEIDNTEFDLVRLLDEICYLQGEPACRKGLALNNIYSMEIPELLHGDPTKIRQIVMNLVSNAIKFTHEGNVDIIAKPSNYKPETNTITIEISVCDDGIGMDQQTQEKVFEVFTQADTSTTREYGGTGLGLSISRHYVDLMNGLIVIDSAPKKGTKIKISIPFKVSKPRQLKHRNIQSAVRIATSNNSTFLMTKSHFELVGVDAEKFNPSDLTNENVYYVIDADSIEDFSALNSAIGTRPESSGVVLVGLNQSPLPSHLQQWPKITKPVTLDSVFKLELDSQMPTNRKNQIQNLDQHSFASSGLSILVAEDVETNQRIISEMLNMLGHRVKIVSDGKAALDLSKNEAFDIIFMDCQMPNLDGFDATTAIRQFEASNKKEATPIVALTAGLGPGDREKCKSAGMNYYVSKPFSVTDIKTAIQKLAKNRKRPSSTSVRSPSRNFELNEKITRASSNNDDVFKTSAIETIIEIEKSTGNDILPSIFEGYVSQMEEKIIELNTVFQDKDSARLYRSAHAVKSMSANIGAEKVRATAADLEICGRKDELTGVREKLEHLTASYDEFKFEFKERYLNS